MDYKKLVEDLRKNLPEKIRYGELVGAPWPYTQQGDLVYEDPIFFDVEKAADAISELVARVESAEARAQTLEKMVKEYQEEIIPGFREQAEKAEMVRDAAIKVIDWIVEATDCPPEICKEICLNHDGICSEHAKLGQYDCCKGFKWIELKEE